MENISFDAVNVGDSLPSITKPPVSRTTLALFAGASNDHNPIHIDSDFARKCGMDDVFAQGMLGMAYLGQLLTGWVPQSALRQFSTRFVAITHLGDEITCTGMVVEKFERNGESCLRLDVQAANQDGDVKLSGQAVVALS
jgi:acyl dehydratase